MRKSGKSVLKKMNARAAKGHCPCCNSDQVSGEEIEVQPAGFAQQMVNCDDCRARWCENYKFYGVSEVAECDEGEEILHA